MKKPMIILVVSLCFLVGAMFYVIKTNKPLEKEIAMDVEYINNNYELDLYEEKVDNNLELFVNGKYIGKDEVVTNPEITLNINCLYVYTDADESYTDVLEDKLVLKHSGSSLKGELTFNLKQEVLDGYSCSYNVDSTTGNYIVK